MAKLRIPWGPTDLKQSTSKTRKTGHGLPQRKAVLQNVLHVNTFMAYLEHRELLSSCLMEVVDTE